MPQTVTTTCYRSTANGTIEGFYSDYFLGKTTTNFSPCCFDTAAYTTDDVCYQSNHSGDDSGYYMALCTDPTYQDPSCTPACIAYQKGNIVFVRNEWFCCGTSPDGDPTCSYPTNETVRGIAAPSALQAVLTNATASASTSASVTTSATSTPSPASQTASSSSGLSTGAKAGIGVGVAVAALLILSVTIAVAIRRRKSRVARFNNSSAIAKEGMADTSAAKYQREDPDSPSELGTLVPPHYQKKDIHDSYTGAEPIEIFTPTQGQRFHEMG